MSAEREPDTPGASGIHHIDSRLSRRIDAYGGSDDGSMADDSTSMFNCPNAYKHFEICP